MDTKESISYLVREKRKKAGWTQEQLASEAGVSTRFLQAIEAGEKMVSVVTLFKLSKALGTTPDTLLMPVWKEWSKQNK